ncbi:MAG: DUF4062 domain-containing protein [Betaproteobacteria bacterium]|nr:DUF4062 domain-containing protein [Betaproteobacteria bacterium]
MLDTNERLKIFISSPGDVPDEREIAEDVITCVNNSFRDTLGIQVDAYTWERLPPDAPNTLQGTIQDKINAVLGNCDAFVLILNKRYGRTAAGHGISNTELEINIALDMLSQNRMKMFMTYFKKLANNEDPGDQEKKIRALRDDLRYRHNVFVRDYKNSVKFRGYFTHDLYHTILRFYTLMSKREALKKFWKLGIPDDATQSKLAIIYPPVDRKFMQEQSDDRIWLERLVPYIVFEDFKALQKIEQTLKLTGSVGEFHFHTVQGKPEHLGKQNRVWLCLPRNESAQKYLQRYEGKQFFRFSRTSEELWIDWRAKVSDPWFKVRSPLNKYLQLQRNESPGGSWKKEHGYVVAKDFAILARFSDPRGYRGMKQGTLKDFFLAGIRGLGTWGAGWFLDKKYYELAKLSDNEGEDVQLLLEVTYVNNRITDVSDVSDKPEDYFAGENVIEEIEKHIRNLKE